MVNLIKVEDVTQISIKVFFRMKFSRNFFLGSIEMISRNVILHDTT